VSWVSALQLFAFLLCSTAGTPPHNYMVVLVVRKTRTITLTSNSSACVPHHSSPFFWVSIDPACGPVQSLWVCSLRIWSSLLMAR